jgi:hypothetical protein
MEHAEEPTPNRLAVRHANRERKRKQRARDKARSDRAVQAYFNRLQAAKVNADGLGGSKSAISARWVKTHPVSTRQQSMKRLKSPVNSPVRS